MAAPTNDPTPFTPDLLDDLPEPARRWLTHSIAPGTPLRRAAVLRQRGEIKVGRWQRFEADWVLAPPEGFIWAATTHLGPLFIRGFDRYTRGSGQMAWRVFGLIPFLSTVGQTSTTARWVASLLSCASSLLPRCHRSCAGRILMLGRCVASVEAGGWTHRVTLTVAASGRLERVDLPRWGNPDGQKFREHTFTALMDGPERTFSGFTIPLGCRAGWWECPDRCATEEFIRFTLDCADYR